MGPQSSKVSLAFQCEGLADKDVTSKSDPFVVVYQADPLRTPLIWVFLGRTEVKKNALSPKFDTQVAMEFHFERKQPLKFEVLDCDDPSQINNLSKHDPLGSAITELSFIVGRRGTATLNLSAPSTKGKITVSALEIGGDNNEFFDFTPEGVALAKMDTFGSCDGYLKIFRIAPSGAQVALYQTEVIKNTLTPKWKAASIGIPSLCGGHRDDPCIYVECWDQDMVTDEILGSFKVSVNQILQSQSFELKSVKGKGKGVVQFNARARRVPSLLDYLRAGFQLNLASSIDFTGSNGDPRNPTSLHFMNPQAPNEYMHGVMAVGEILTNYVTDKRFGCYGFGGRLPDGNVSHYFPLSLDPRAPDVGSVQEILNLYAATLLRVGLSGPTNFAPTINAAVVSARQRRHTYSILLILTDGDITDMMDTVDAIVAADDAPLSIVIVGIGAHDFMGMQQLDADDRALVSTTGRTSRRDTVQFVPFRKFAACQPMLAAEVLKEIPQQFLKWTQLANVPPPVGVPVVQTTA